MTLTKQQREALYKVYQRWNIETSYREFRKKVVPELGGWGAVMIQVPGGMWLGIEKDGYTHS